MPTRRDFLTSSAIASFAAVAGSLAVKSVANAAVGQTTRAHPGVGSARIKSLVRRDETILRYGAGGSGYVFPMSWTADGDQVLVVTDGAAFARPATKFFHSRVVRASGYPPHLGFADMPGYPDMLMKIRESENASFWGGGCLALDGRIYQFLATSNHSYLRPDVSFNPDFYWIGSKLIYSEDDGATWRNQDGSTPVVWEKWGERSRDNMAFFNERPSGSFTWLTALQMGQNYRHNKDGFLYIYSPNGYADGSVNELVMFRVPKSRLLDRRCYEFFAGCRAGGKAIWTKDLSARSPVHTFPMGWVNSGKLPGETPWAWVPSITYNAPLGVYMMSSWGTGCSAEGGWFAKPSYLGFWMAPAPWGPFRQIHEEQAWTPGNDPNARAFMPQIAPKWISEDGRSFWLVWSDYQYKGSTGENDNPDQGFFNDVRDIADEAEIARVVTEWAATHMPRSSLNMQRVDLVLSWVDRVGYRRTGSERKYL